MVVYLQDSEPSSSGSSSSNAKTLSTRPSKLTAAMLGITRKKKKLDDELIEKQESSPTKSVVGGLNLLSGYSSTSDSSDPE